jgi:predicted transcriptional regulator
MTKLFDEAVEAARLLPDEAQDEIARLVLHLAAGTDDEPEEIDPEHLAAVLEGLDEIRRGEIATEEEVAAAFRKFEA